MLLFQTEAQSQMVLKQKCSKMSPAVTKLGPQVLNQLVSNEQLFAIGSFAHLITFIGSAYQVPTVSEGI